ncbi:MAG: hypothetical protein ABIK47_02235 [candidate division WOR-3 bacterium]
MNFQQKKFFLILALFSTALATKYAGDFEELGASARAIGMGGAVVAASADPSAIYYNPALSARLRRPSVLLMHSEDFSGLVKHNFIGLAFPDKHQTFGFALLHNGIPGIKLTRLPNPDSPPGENNRPYVDRIVNANQLVGYINFARILSPALALGANAKIIYQNLGGTASCFGMGFDFGINLTPLSDIDIGLRIRNLSTSPLFWDTGTKEFITPRPALGAGRLFRFGRNKLRLAIEAEAALEEKSLFTNLGCEYSFREIIYARLGSYRNNFSFGLGFRFKRFYLDYGYATGVAPEARELGSPQQISGGVEF